MLQLLAVLKGDDRFLRLERQDTEGDEPVEHRPGRYGAPAARTPEERRPSDRGPRR